jgi:hypothetical protein
MGVVITGVVIMGAVIMGAVIMGAVIMDMVVRLQVRLLLADYSDTLLPTIDIEHPEPFIGLFM